MSKQFDGIVYNLWNAHRSSFSHEDAVRESTPLMTAMIVGVYVIAVLGTTFIPPLLGYNGLTDMFLPLLLVGIAGMCSIGSWYVGKKSGNLLTLCQLLDVSFYGASAMCLAVLSGPPMSYGFSGFFGVMCFRWGQFYSLSLLGVLSVAVGPVVVTSVLGADVTTVILLCFGIVFFMYMSLSTKQSRLTKEKEMRSKEAVSHLDNLLSVSEKNLSLTAELHWATVIHKAKNDLVPTVMDLNIIKNKGTLPSQDVALIDDCIGSVVESITTLENYLSKEDDSDSTVLFCSFADFVKKVNEECINATVQFSDSVFESDYYFIRVDPAQIVGVLKTLIENSIEAKATQIEINGNIDSQSNMLQMTVRDNGPGLPESILKRLFEPHNTFGKVHGVGLGLFLAQKTMRVLGGDLSLDKSDDSGTVFLLELPYEY